MAGNAPYTDEEVLRRFASMVYRLALSQTKNKADAEDVFQEVFLRYVRTNTAFYSEEHIKAWLLHVTVNRCRKLWASAWFRKTVPLEEIPSSALPEDAGIAEAVAALPEKYRAVVHLFYFEDLPVREIAQALGRPESTVTSQLHRARAMLREKLKGEDQP